MDEDAYRRGLNQGGYTGGDWDSYRQGVNTREWNERSRPAAGSDSGSGWSTGAGSSGPGGGPSTAGGPGGSVTFGRRELGVLGVLALLAGGFVSVIPVLLMAIPSLLMAVQATPFLKLSGTLTGRREPIGWGRALLAGAGGSLLYLALTVAVCFGVVMAVESALGGESGVRDDLTGWQQWLAAAWWSGLALIDSAGTLLGTVLGMDLSSDLPPAPGSAAMLAAAVTAVNLPGLGAYAVVLQRVARVRGAVRALSLAALLVCLTAPLAVALTVAPFVMTALAKM